jgi:predicted TIM-barrel fold metal-dependent hydrolase
MKIIAVEEHWSREGTEKVEERLKEMDEAGIDMQVISSTLIPGLEISAEEARKWAMGTNDAFAGIIEKYPERFAAFAAIALHEPEIAARELERTVTHYGFKGAMIGAEITGYLDEPEYAVLLETATDLDVPIYLHPKVPTVNMVEPFLAYPILSRSMWGFAADAGLHAMRLIMSGTFEKYPGLQIILGHLGEGIPFWLWRLDNRWLREKDGWKGLIEADPSARILKKNPSQYFKDHFHVAISGMFWAPALQMTITALGADRVLFAVDCPAESSEVAVDFIRSIPINEREKEKICHLNAERLLKL